MSMECRHELCMNRFGCFHCLVEVASWGVIVYKWGRESDRSHKRPKIFTVVLRRFDILCTVSGRTYWSPHSLIEHLEWCELLDIAVKTEKQCLLSSWDVYSLALFRYTDWDAFMVERPQKALRCMSHFIDNWAFVTYVEISRSTGALAV